MEAILGAQLETRRIIFVHTFIYIIKIGILYYIKLFLPIFNSQSVKCVTKKEINLLDVYTFLHVRDSQIRCLPDNSMIMLTLFISCEEDVRQREGSTNNVLRII